MKIELVREQHAHNRKSHDEDDDDDNNNNNNNNNSNNNNNGNMCYGDVDAGNFISESTSR